MTHSFDEGLIWQDSPFFFEQFVLRIFYVNYMLIFAIMISSYHPLINYV